MHFGNQNEIDPDIESKISNVKTEQVFKTKCPENVIGQHFT